MIKLHQTFNEKKIHQIKSGDILYQVSIIKLHQMKKKKYAKLNLEIFYTKFSLKKITPIFSKNTPNAIMKYFTQNFHFKKGYTIFRNNYT